MQLNYWKFAAITLFLILLCGGLFFLLNNSSDERPLSGSQSNTELNGEVFLVTQGSGNLKIGLAEVIIENQETKQTFRTTTNADGKFSISVPSGSYLLNANSTRIYQMRLSGDSDKEILAKNVMDKSLAEKYSLYQIAILLQKQTRMLKLESGGASDYEVKSNFVQISEYYNWKFPISLSQSKQSLQLSNNNLTDFGLTNNLRDK
jgi:hypothetical protein